MGFHLQNFLLFFQLVAIVRGDVLLDYAERSFEELPNWILENVEDEFILTYPYYTQRNGAFMGYELKPHNITANGMKTIHLLEKPSFVGSLYTGRVDVNLTVMVDLELSGIYEASGNLFPYVDRIPFKSSGKWSANTSLAMTQSYHISMNVSKDGLMTSEFYLSKYTPQTSISDFNFDKFLEDHLNQWYYPISKEGFGKELEERALSYFGYNDINVFRGFIDKVFKNINYSDIVGNQP